MKLASYRDGSRDGQLVVVSRDLATAHYATGIATRLQQVLDDWNFLSPQLQELSRALDQGRARHAFAFDPAQCEAPLPRAFQWADGPTLCQRPGDALLGARDPLLVTSEALELDFEAGLAVITGDVPQAASPGAALEGVRLVMLVNGWRLRAEGAGHPPGAFAPVAVTPDELGPAWHGGRVRLNIEVAWNGKRVGLCDAAEGMPAPFGELVAKLARTRAARAGSIVGSGPLTSDPSRGFAAVVHRRADETRDGGDAKTPFLKVGDSLRLDMKGADGHSVFGSIDQDVQAWGDEPEIRRGAARGVVEVPIPLPDDEDPTDA